MHMRSLFSHLEQISWYAGQFDDAFKGFSGVQTKRKNCNNEHQVYKCISKKKKSFQLFLNLA